jgi:hypothetical protein
MQAPENKNVILSKAKDLIPKTFDGERFFGLTASG